MTAILLAGVSALVWGSADYCGGRATHRGSALGVTVLSQIYGLPALAGFAVLIPGVIHHSDLIWGAVAGIAGLIGIVLLYQGLASGAMAVVAPITAVTGAVLPMTVGLLTQRAPSALALGGAVCAIVAIAFVSLGPSGSTNRVSARVVLLALGAGAMFGVFFVLLAQTHGDAGMWPLVAVRCVSVTVGVVYAIGRGVSLRPPKSVGGWVLAAGIGDIAANVLYLLAIRGGLLSVVAPIAALYPVSTVLLALTLDKERVRPIQIAGLGLAATALVLTAV